MQTRALHWDGAGLPRETSDPMPPVDDGWAWIDVILDAGAAPDMTDPELDVLDVLRLDAIALHDAVHEDNLPKVDDFDDHILVVLHGLRDDRVETYEVDCFIFESVLVTFHDQGSPTVDALWTNVQQHPELADGGCGEVAARLADGLTRRLLAVVDAFDDRVDELMAQALVAERTLLADVAAVRADLAKVRRVVAPQREALDRLRTSESHLIDQTARRRYADVFDVASRAASGLETSRSALAETLDAYRGAEARDATQVTKVLTVYAAVVLPLSLIAGIFGMNHRNLPTIRSEHGWLWAFGLMALVAAVSIGVFVAEGWIGRPSGRRAGASLGRGLLEAARAPVQVAGAVYEISSLPLRSAMVRNRRPRGDTTSGPPSSERTAVTRDG